MKELFDGYKIVILSILFIFFILFAGYYTSPSFTQEQSFLEAIGTSIALLFVFSIMVVLSAIGLNSFAIFLSIFLAMAISLYGVEAGIITIGLSYVVWGLVFAIELLLVHNNNQTAIDWFKERYTSKSFEIEYKIFYPMLWIFYFLLEVVPHYLFGDKINPFYPHEVKKRLKSLLKS
jgi:hypothetical protein